MPTTADWLGLSRVAPDRWSFELTPDLLRFDGMLYGGTGLAVVTALAEAHTGRDALWSTVQFVSSAAVGERLDIQVDVLAQGKRTTQLRFSATAGDRLVLAALAATGEPRSNGLELQIGEIPVVSPPDDSPEWTPRVPFIIPEDDRGWLGSVDLRGARPAPGSSVGAGLTLWARMRSTSTSRASLGFVADMVPSAVVRAAGRTGGGSSLDNTIRFGPAPTTEWVLIELDPQIASSGYVHGVARLWGADGTLLAVASQTAVAIHFD